MLNANKSDFYIAPPGTSLIRNVVNKLLSRVRENTWLWLKLTLTES